MPQRNNLKEAEIKCSLRRRIEIFFGNRGLAIDIATYHFLTFLLNSNKRVFAWYLASRGPSIFLYKSVDERQIRESCGGF